MTAAAAAGSHTASGLRKKGIRDRNMEKNIVLKKLLVMPLLAAALLLCSCRYDPPEGYTKKHHTYDELVEYAQSIDPDATVEDEPRDENYKYRDYVIYPAKIGGIECSVASISVPVYDSDWGEFAKFYYRMDTDYDFYVIKEVLKKYPDLGTLENDDLQARFNVGGFIRSTAEFSKMSEAKLDEIFDEFKRCREDLGSYPLHKKYWLDIKVNGSSHNVSEPTEEQKQKVKEKMAKYGRI